MEVLVLIVYINFGFSPYTFKEEVLVLKVSFCLKKWSLKFDKDLMYVKINYKLL